MEAARKSPFAAFLLSFIPGVGHLYAGRTGAGIAWLVATVLGYQAFGGFGLVLHLVCAVSAASATAEANRREEAGLATRRESAAEVARILDAAVGRGGVDAGPGPSPEATADPPPRIMRGAFPVPPEALLRALAGAMREGGLLVLGEDERNRRVRGSLDHGGGRSTMLVAQVEPTPSGSRVRLLVDRPEGSLPGPGPDDEVLRGLLERTDRLLRGGTVPGAAAGASPPAAAIVGGGEALTEDHFLEQLREAWESYDQGWLPEPEWLQRKRSLLRSVTLRAGTRKSDFMTVCRPLVEAGVLDVADLRALESSIPG